MTSRSIGICVMLKNNEQYVRRYLCKALKDLCSYNDEKCGIGSHVYVYENDSVDGTADAIRTDLVQALGSERMTVYTEHLDFSTLGSSLFGNEYDRIQRIALVRNTFLEKIREELNARNHEWVLFIDADVMFEDCTVEKMINAARPDYAMITCGTTEIDALTRTTNNHYFDTFALTLKDSNKTYWPNCPLAICTQPMCKQNGVGLRGTFEVRAAWAGFALVDATVFKNSAVKWASYNCGGTNSSICEHVHFCDAVRVAAGGRKVMVCSDIICYWMRT